MGIRFGCKRIVNSNGKYYNTKINCDGIRHECSFFWGVYIVIQMIKGTALRNVTFGGITYVLAEDIYYNVKGWAPIEPRAQVKSPEGAEMYWYFPDMDSLAAWIDTGNLDTCIQGVLIPD